MVITYRSQTCWRTKLTIFFLMAHPLPNVIILVLSLLIYIFDHVSLMVGLASLINSEGKNMNHPSYFSLQRCTFVSSACPLPIHLMLYTGQKSARASRLPAYVAGFFSFMHRCLFGASGESGTSYLHCCCQSWHYSCPGSRSSFGARWPKTLKHFAPCDSCYFSPGHFFV